MAEVEFEDLGGEELGSINEANETDKVLGEAVVGEGGSVESELLS